VKGAFGRQLRTDIGGKLAVEDRRVVPALGVLDKGVAQFDQIHVYR
jgi:hypothetical protein